MSLNLLKRFQVLENKLNTSHRNPIEVLIQELILSEDPSINAKCWHTLSINPLVTPDIVRKYPSFQWNWANLCSNLSMTQEFVLENLDKLYNTCIYNLTHNPMITTQEFVLAHPKGFDYPGWDPSYLSMNPLMSPEFILTYPNGDFTKKSLLGSTSPKRLTWWNMTSLSYNSSVTGEFILSTLNEDWNTEKLSLYITSEFVLEYPTLPSHPFPVNGKTPSHPFPVNGKTPSHPFPVNGKTPSHPFPVNGKRWCIQNLCENPNITLDFVLWCFNSVKEWRGFLGYQCMVNLSDNPALTLDFLEKYPKGFYGFGWSMSLLSANPCVTQEFILANPKGINNNGWDFYALNRNPNVTMEFHEKMGWGIDGLHLNPNLTLEYLKKKRVNWCTLNVLQGNPFTKVANERRVMLEELEKIREEAARIIWYKAWLPYWYKPGKGKGYVKDLREFLSLVE